MRSSSPCIDHLGGDKYRCRNLGITITTTQLPIICVCGRVQSIQSQKAMGRSLITPQYTTGTIMHDLLSERLGVGMKTGCACKAWIDQMNIWGPAESRENLVKIVNALLAEAKRREWKLDGRPMLSVAASVGTALPGGMIFARAWTRKLVTEAINRSEQNEKPEVDVRGNDRT